MTMRAVTAIDALGVYAVKGRTTMAWAEAVGAWTMENEKKTTVFLCIVYDLQ